MRGFHQEEGERAALAKLEDKRTVFLKFDLAMKWLPRRFREPMDKWLGLWGLVWQVCLAWYRDEHEADLKIKAYVQLFGSEKQESFTVFSCLEQAVKEMVAEDFPNMKELILSSDNAGYYHCNGAVCGAVPRIAEHFHLDAVEYLFMEPQKGSS